jgi:uncharacterized cupredoxin-like copper-binding protein
MKSKSYLFALASGLVLAVPGAMAATINTTLHDNAIQLDSNTVVAGKVTFVITNASGKLVHELVVLKTDLAVDQLPVNLDGKVDEAKLNNKGEVENIAPGKTKRLTLKLSPGKYVIVCNIPDHYKMGMRAGLTVKK